jgi:ribosomal protein S18 acetylase RimI-like enzyme
MPDYGHVDDDTPSLAIAVLKPYRNRGIGTALLKGLLESLRAHGFRKASLSVQKENPAVHLYQRLGFKVIRESEEEYIMVSALSSE